MTHHAYRRLFGLLLVALVFLPSSGFAVTFLESTEPCPVCDKPTTVSAIMSYGSYIYHDESKYDLIYFPFTSEANFWYSPDCGYVQPLGHFSEISKEEIEDVRGYLAENFEAGEELSFVDKLNRCEEIGAIRGWDQDEREWFNRVMIYNLRGLDEVRMKELVGKEIEMLKDGKGDLPSDSKCRDYLLGEYHRILGDTATAREHLEESISASTYMKMRIIGIAAGIGGIVSLCLMILLRVRLEISPKVRKSLIALCRLGIIVGAVIMWFYAFPFSPITKEAIAQDAYYTKIAQDRLDLLDE